jgi:hypothetical protein
MCLTLNEYLKAKFGVRVQKIPLDAGLNCPNRDGTKGKGGCIYCNGTGSGTGAAACGKDLHQQMEDGMKWAQRRYGATRFLSYLQSFSNTYAPLKRLAEIYRTVLAPDEVVGISIATRPDCIDEERLMLIKEVAGRKMVWMEYGLQSANDATLKRINRGHSFQDFVNAVNITHEFGIPVCCHVIFGLPGETPEDMQNTIERVRMSGVEGIKFHQLSVLKGTCLQRLWEDGDYQPISQGLYTELVAWAVRHLGSECVIHRLAADHSADVLLAPLWSLKKAETIQMIYKRLNCNKHNVPKFRD